MAEIKQVNVNSTAYDIAAKYMLDGSGNLKDWAAIIALVNTAKLKILVCSKAANTPLGVTFTPKGSSESITGTLKAAEGDTQTFYFVYDGDGTNDSYLEYVTNGTIWEPLGRADVDLSGYVQKGVTYSNAALSAGSHDHTVTVPTITVDKTKKLGAIATGAAVGADGTESVVPSYTISSKKLATTSVTGVSGSTTASKATAGTAVTVAKAASTATTVGNANVGEAVSIPNVTGNSSVSATLVDTPSVVTVKQVDTVSNGTAATFTQGSKASWSASVDANGVLSFSFAANGDDTFTANTPTSVTTANVTGVVKSGASTPDVSTVTASNITLGSAISVTPAVASTTEITGVNGTETITPYTFADVTVPTAASLATTVATGSLTTTGSGADIVESATAATAVSVLTGVKVTAQPTITITETTATGATDEVINEHTTTSTTSATTSTTGAHTHDVNVANS